MAALSFFFFAAMMVVVYMRAHFGYFLLATGFGVIFLLTMIGWWMQRRNVVEIYDHGMAFKKFIAQWIDISAVESTSEGSLRLTCTHGETVVIPRSIAALDRLESYITGRVDRSSGS